MTEWLFAAPWWLLTLGWLIAAALWFNGNRRQDRTLKNIAYALTVVTALVAFLSFMVETPTEFAVKTTRSFVAAVAAKDGKTLQGLMAPAAHLSVLNGSLTPYHSAADISAAATAAASDYHVTDAYVRSMQVQTSASLITVTVDVFSTQDFGPMTSTWTFDYEDTGGGWALTQITAVKIAGKSSADFAGQFPRLHQ